jgi:hypothetical protein
MNKKLFIGLVLSFITATIIGTLSHEFGHYLVAKYLGYEARINYGATFWHSLDPEDPLNLDDSFAITLGGPIQTMLTGTIGLCFLLIFQKSFYKINNLTFGQWLTIFVSLFWLRQTANFCVWMGKYFLSGEISSRGDEICIANYLNLPVLSVISTTACIGALVLALITFKFIPDRQRITFLAAGLVGGITGYLFWLVFFGKYILP